MPSTPELVKSLPAGPSQLWGISIWVPLHSASFAAINEHLDPALHDEARGLEGEEPRDRPIAALGACVAGLFSVLTQSPLFPVSVY